MLVYLAGKYRGNEVNENIALARKVSTELWEKGYRVLSPHLNTAHFEDDCNVSDHVYLEAYLDMLSRCDAIVVLPNWKESHGTKAEIDYAQANDIPVYYYPRLPEFPRTEKTSPVQVDGFRNIVMRMYRVHLSKNHDYSPANILGTGSVGLTTRIWDKVARLMNLTGHEVTAKFESIHPAKDTETEVLNPIFIGMQKIFKSMGFNVKLKASARSGVFKPKHESIMDTALDLAVYAIIFILYRTKKWGK